jgi:hypothetical protein
MAKSGGQGTGWRTIPIVRNTSVLLCAGRRFPTLEESLLARFSNASIPASVHLPDGHGFTVERVDPVHDGRSWLALTRRSSGSIELFQAMACDVADAVDAVQVADEPQLLRVFLGRVRAWQDFMRKGSSPLGPEAEVGLIGELSALSAIIDAGVSPAAACESWVGPLDGLRDFELGTGALEIKSTISPSGFPARVGTLEQLDDTLRQPLFLAGVRLRMIASGQVLPEFVEGMRDIVRGEPEAERLLAERLLSAGYLDAHAESYSRRFALADMRILPVTGDFPRLTPASVPAGVTRAAYEIDLDRIIGPNLMMDTALKDLGVI